MHIFVYALVECFSAACCACAEESARGALVDGSKDDPVFIFADVRSAGHLGISPEFIAKLAPAGVPPTAPNVARSGV